MNAIDDNQYTRHIKKLGEKIRADHPKIKAILCVSAHWLTRGTFVTSAETPKMIYDMQGFPDELYQVKYPALGSSALAQRITQLEGEPQIHSDQGSWGLDHGTWSVLVHLFPEAKIPVLQLSIDITQPGPFHLEMGRRLQALRDEGVLIIGSGNIVHNLRKISWTLDATPFPWAIEFDSWAKAKLQDHDFSSLTQLYDQFPAGQMSVPTPDHYFPMLYILGASIGTDKFHIEYEEMQNASISMLSFRYD